MSRLKFETPIHPFQFLKRFMPRSLFGRSLIILMTPLIVVQVILSFIFFDKHTDSVLDMLAESIVGDVMMVIDMIDRDVNIKEIQRTAKKNFKFKVTLDPKGKITRFGAYRDRWLYQHMREHLNERLNYLYFLRITDNIYIEIPHKKGLLEIEMSKRRLYNRSTPDVVIWTAVSALLLFIVASLFMRNQIRPIRRLADAAEKFGKGVDTLDFRPEGATEVRKAGVAFNVMRERLGRYIQERTEMLAGVSHDLRTPLTRMKLQLAMMKDSQDVQYLKDDVDQMQQMVQGFLDFARGEGNQKKESASINDLLDRLVSDFRYTILDIHLSCPPDLKWQIKYELFKRCLTNLLLNSERYAHNVWVDVQVETTDRDSYLVVSVSDDGPGIPPEERENVFRPFYRIDKSRNLDKGGVGLGMNIARDVVHQHGGTMKLQDSSHGGLKVVMRIPS